MPSHSVMRNAIQILEHHAGIVIPVYFRPDTNREWAAQILRETVLMFVREIADPAALCLSVDGPGVAADIAGDVARETLCSTVFSEENRGKLSAVHNGMACLLHDEQFQYIVCADQDGDHFANELLNFVRAAEHVQHETGVDQVLVLGERLSRHRPLGFLRAEHEELANRILVDALTYHAALSGRPLNLTFAHSFDGLPDFHSGYKLFSRRVASDLVNAPPQLAGCGEEAYFRHAVEAVLAVESILSGATLATVNRRTLDEQPVSLFAELDRSRLAADMVLWPCRRLNVPAPFIVQWLANHTPRLLLGTLLPHGRAELLAIRDLVLTGYGLSTDAESDRDVPRPQFI